MTKTLAVAALLLPALALGQEAQKFNAKALEKTFPKLAVYAPKGGVVENEVIFTRSEHQAQAVYVVKGDAAKVVDFYKGKLKVEPTKTGDQALGDVKYTFAIPLAKGDKRVSRLTLTPLDSGVQITLFERDVTEDDKVPEDE
jgi:hypothetical protein